MDTFLCIVISGIAAYLCGAIPTGYWLGRWLKGIDIREHGSKNMGATNVFRVLGPWPGSIVLAIDMAKGFIPPVWIANAFAFDSPVLLVFLGVAAVIGHNWTIFLGFKGGKGVATSLGVLLGLTAQIPGMRPVVLITIGLWVLIFLLFGYVSLASILAAVFLPIAMIVYQAPFVAIAMSIVLCLFIVFRHRSNISRLLTGQENRVRLPFFKKN